MFYSHIYIMIIYIELFSVNNMSIPFKVISELLANTFQDNV